MKPYRSRLYMNCGAPRTYNIVWKRRRSCWTERGAVKMSPIFKLEEDVWRCAVNAFIVIHTPNNTTENKLKRNENSLEAHAVRHTTSTMVYTDMKFYTAKRSTLERIVQRYFNIINVWKLCYYGVQKCLLFNIEGSHQECPPGIPHVLLYQNHQNNKRSGTQNKKKYEEEEYNREEETEEQTYDEILILC